MEYGAIDLHKNESQVRIVTERGEVLDRRIATTRRILKEYVTYYSRTRTHLGLDKDAPFPRPVAPLTAGRVIAIPQVGGLHHWT